MAHRVIWLLLFTGCNTIVQPERCAGTCIADPDPHCIKENDCLGDTDCPSGLSCVAPLPNGDLTACGASGVDDRRRCGWGLPFVYREALRVGFETGSMEITVVGGTDPHVEWHGPAATQFVKCAVFTCDPEVRDRDVQNDADESPTGTPLRHIANAAACMFDNLAPVDAAQTSLALRAGSPSFAETCTAEAVYRDRVIDFVAVACWAYDTYRVIAASDLVPLDLDTARKVLSEPLPVDCGPGTFGVCYNSRYAYFGICAPGGCQPRCFDPVDCEFATGTAGAAGDVCSWKCQPVAGSRVGVCVPNS